MSDRNRPYDGQPWTDQGDRGKTIVSGLTMRDVADCLIKAMLHCAPMSPEDALDYAVNKVGRNITLSEKASNGSWEYGDVYKIDMTGVDPIAISQNLTCEIERMMGIFPNIPPYDPSSFK